jgi:hypothetical protein
MSKIIEFFKKPYVLGTAGLVLGLIVGLVALGWGLWPVKWIDAAPVDLEMEYQRDYLCMVIDSYIRNPDDNLVQIRWAGLGENAHDLLDSLTPTVCRFSSSAEIEAFSEMMNLVGEPVAMIEEDELAAVEPLVEDISGSGVSILPLAILILMTLVVGGIFVFLLMKRAKSGSSSEPKVRKVRFPGSDAKIKVQEKSAPVSTSDPPLCQFMTTYRQGDDLYDDSFSIDSINGEFLGECGVGVAETIGVGEPKKVTALEVWLFDKNDIQTVTKVLMSEHAFNDSAIRQRLLSKGDPIAIEPGSRFVMETDSLQLEAKVIDLVYARGPLPENSYFSRLTLEISAWSK